MTRSPGDNPVSRASAPDRPDGHLSGGLGKGSAPESVTRGQKILIAMLAATLGSIAAGTFSLKATMNANFAALTGTTSGNFTAVNGHLLSLQEQVGRLDARVARLEALIETGLAPVAPWSSREANRGSPPGS